MVDTVQAARVTPLAALEVLRETAVRTADNGLNYAMFGETRVPDAELARMVESVPRVMAQALKRARGLRCWTTLARRWWRRRTRWSWATAPSATAT